MVIQDAGSETVVPVTIKLPPMNTFPPIPAPPSTRSAPDDVLVELIVFLINISPSVITPNPAYICFFTVMPPFQSEPPEYVVPSEVVSIGLSLVVANIVFCVPDTNKSPEMYVIPFMYVLPVIPAPPFTTSAPVASLVLSVVPPI